MGKLFANLQFGCIVTIAQQAVVSDFHKAKEDLAEFFNENKDGKLTKTKSIYMIYSMMTDYGTHRNESTKECPTIEDALFMLRLTDSISFWVYSMTNR